MASPVLPLLGACVAFVVLGSQAHAQSAAAVLDCDAAKNAKAPVELSFHLADGTRVTSQMHRENAAAADFVYWSRVEFGTSTFVTKYSFVGGLPTESQESSTLSGKLKSTTRKFSFEGLSGDFDRRSDIQYKLTITAAYADGTTAETSVTNSYQFKSEDTVTVGSCVLDAIHGATNILEPRTGKSTSGFQIYFPELKLAVLDREREPAIDGLKTTFTPITPIS